MGLTATKIHHFTTWSWIFIEFRAGTTRFKLGFSFQFGVHNRRGPVVKFGV